jgi:hypothetical protein
MRTIAEGNAESTIPDFVILHLCSEHIPQNHEDYERLGCRRITHECCAVVMEEKRAPRRSLRGDEFDVDLDDSIDLALKDLGVQCYCLFNKYPRLNSTIAIAASGDWWTYSEVPKAQAPTAWGDELNTVAWHAFTTTWPKPVQIGSTQSDERFDDILRILNELPNITVHT